MDKITVNKEYERENGEKITRNYTGINPNASPAQIRAAFDAIDSLTVNTQLRTTRTIEEDLN